jgi:outer membrane protein OmpA-like peptidoglycan-associated protein
MVWRRSSRGSTAWARTATVALLTAGAPAAQAGAQVRIPLCRGLTIVGAVSEPAGDYEPIVTIDSVTGHAVELTYATQVQTPAGLRNTVARRTVLTEDLASATLVEPWFGSEVARRIPGTTAIGSSRAVLRALKAGATVELGVLNRSGAALPARHDVHPNIYELRSTYRVRRAEPGTVGVPVTVNGDEVTLPTIHAAGKYLDERAEFFFLDDEDNPLILRYQLSSIAGTPPTATRTVKIAFHCSAAGPGVPADRLERALLETGRAEVYDIYFDFNSDRIREQSEPTLREIAGVLGRHPDWKLAIEGHTDSVASDRFNLELSQRRAAAVKSALAGRFAVDSGRLTTAGYGESRPKDRNDTPEGRARNRRVELVRTS